MNTLMSRKMREITQARNITGRVDGLDWGPMVAELDAQGCAVIEKLITPEECDALAGLYQKEGIFRSRVVMARHGFGRGEYKYFSYPLPDIIHELRTSIYSRLTPIANHWNRAMGIKVLYPAKHADFIKRCHDRG